MTTEEPTLHTCFERDITYLQQNMHPLEVSGKKVERLDYEGKNA